MKACLLVLGLTLFALSQTVSAQPRLAWSKTYVDVISRTCNDIAPCAVGGFIFVGDCGSAVWLVRIDDNGDTLWIRAFGMDGRTKIGRSVVETPDGGFVFGGTNLGKFWLVKTDSHGDEIWSKTYGNLGRYYCFSMIQTRDGGFALAGSTIPVDSLYSNACLMRFNSNGDSLWTRTYGGNRSDGFSTLVELSSGGFALSGSTASYSVGHSDIYLVITDERGYMAYQRSFGHQDGDDICYSIVEHGQGGLALAGLRFDYGYQWESFWLIVTDSRGMLGWSKTYGGSQDYEGCRAMVKADNFGFVMAGYTMSFGAGGKDIWLLRVSLEGDSLWSTTFGGARGDDCYAIERLADGSYLLGGTSNSEGEESPSDFYLVKTTPDPVSVREPQVVAPFALHLAQPYPNPFNGTVTIPFGLDKSAPTRLEIFDPLGRRVAELIPTGLVNGPYAGGKQSVAWDANGMPAGQYIVRLEAGNQQLSRRLSLVK